MEPVWVELKLTNAGEQPQLVDAATLDADSLTVVLKKDGAPARQLVPFRQKCVEPETKVLQPGESLYGTVLVSAGLNGWDVAEPGRYTIQAAAHVGETAVVSQALEVRIAPPVSREEEYLAGDLFTQDPARTLVFGGTQALGGANDVLAEIVERLPDRRIAIHASVALGGPLTIDYKQLEPKGDDLAFAVKKAKPDEAAEYLEPALVEKSRRRRGHVRPHPLPRDRGADGEAPRRGGGGGRGGEDDRLGDRHALGADGRGPAREGRGDRAARGGARPGDLRLEAEGQAAVEVEGEDLDQWVAGRFRSPGRSRPQQRCQSRGPARPASARSRTTTRGSSRSRRGRAGRPRERASSTRDRARERRRGW